MADITSEPGLVGGTSSSAAKADGTGLFRRFLAGQADRAADNDTAGQLLRQCDAMVRFALGQGLRIPPELTPAIALLENRGATPPALSDIVNLHGHLAEVVAPAKPRTIYLLQEDRALYPFLNTFGPLQNIRRLMLMAFLSTAAFVLISLSDNITAENMTKGVYAMSGVELLTVMMFLMSAAALGACFNALFAAHNYISAGTYDTRFDSSYWMRIGLGVISGLLVAELIPLESLIDPGAGMTSSAGTADGAAGGAGAGAGAGGGAGNVVINLGKPMLALLGGFSANLLYSILQKLVQTVQSLFQSDPAQAKDIQERDMRTRIDQQVAQSRMSSATTLVALQDAIAKGVDKDQLSALVSQALSTLVPGASTTAPAPGVPATVSAGAGASGANAGNAAEPSPPAGQG